MLLEHAIFCWATSSAVLLVAGITVRRRLPQTCRLARSVSLSLPLTWLLTPSLGFGTIVLPVPAGAILILIGTDMVRGIRQVQGPNLINGPLACVMLAIGLAIFTALSYDSAEPNTNEDDSKKQGG